MANTRLKEHQAPRHWPVRVSSPLKYVGHGTDQERAALLERLPDGFVSVDSHWQVTYVNRQAEVVLGKTREELLGRNICEVFPTSADSVFSLKAHEGSDKRISLAFTDFHPLLHKWLAVRLYPFEDDFYILFQDITEQAEQFLQSQTKRGGEGKKSIIVTNLQGKIIYWNEGAQAIFGYTAEEMLGQTPALLYPQREQQQLGRDLEQIRKGKDYRDLWKGRRKDGSTVWIDIKTTLLCNSQGKALGFIGIAHEITSAYK